METKTPNKKRHRRLVRFIKYQILHANDSPCRIALGAALGFFVAWTPAVGLHILIVIALSFIFRANKAVSIACVWVNNPFTMIGIYYPNYIVGRALMRLFGYQAGPSKSQFREMLNSWGDGNFFEYDFWHNLFSLLWRGYPELWVGSIVMGTIAATAAGFLTYYAVVGYRSKHPHKRFEF